MKILQLRIKNIHSLKGEHNIDFANGLLATAGLFAIVGPTGSGKSTLLDAITLALYNRIPRVSMAITKAVVEDQGVILTQHTRDCYAEVDFEVRGKVYRSHWSIERNKNNNLNERKHFLYDAASGVTLEESSKNVVERNQEIIGLSYEQFVQSMVLAQGQFAKLLHASKNERNKLLEEITGAGIYRKIGAKVFNKWREAKEVVQNLEVRLGEIQLLPAPEVAAALEVLAHGKIAQQNIEVQLTRTTAQVQWRKDLNHLQAKQQKLLEQTAAVKERTAALAPERLRLTHHELFVGYKEAFQNFDLQAERVQEAAKQALNQQTAFDKATAAYQNNLEVAQQLLGSETAAQTVVQDLKAFRAAVQNLLDAENESFTIAKSANLEVDNKVKALLSLGISFKRTDNTLELAQAAENELAAQCAAAGATDLETIKAQQNLLLKQLNTAQKLIGTAQLLARDSFSHQSKAALLIADQAAMAALQLQVIGIKTKLVAAEQAAQNQLQVLEKAQTEAGLAGYRNKLAHGDACPLCGALDHPYAHNHTQPELAALATAHQLQHNHWKMLEAELKKLEQKGVKLETVAAATQNNISELLAAIEAGKTACAALAETLNWPANEAVLAYEERQQQLETTHKNWETLEQSFRAQQSFRELVVQQMAYEEARKNFEHAKMARVQRYPGKDVAAAVQELVAALNLHQTQQENSAHLRGEWHQKQSVAQAAVAQLQQHLTQVAQNAGFGAMAAVREKILAETEAESIRKRLLEVQKQHDQLAGQLEEVQAQLAEKTVQFDLKATLEVLELQLNTIKNDHQKLIAQLAQTTEKLRHHTAQELRAKELQSALKLAYKQLQLWQTMNDLIGDATGNKFSNFVQELTLEQLIAFGNRRLSGLTDRYLLTLPKTADKGGDTLQVIDLHLGQTVRAVATLSGGETFKISLAMALGLSDLAARNVQIESLFVDEGFGTLDPEALNDALSVLETMQHESGKSIGIISHVSELKERIAAKIKLVPVGNGYSRVEVG